MSQLHPLHETQSHRVVAWGRVLIASIMALMVVQLLRVAQLKVQPNERLASAVGTPISSKPELTRRGDLLDRRGRVIATSTLGYRLFVDPSIVADPSTIALDLGALLRIDPVAIDKRLVPRLDTRYAVVVDVLEDWQVDAVRHARIRGVGLEPRLVRHYPHGTLASALVGMVGFEHTGLAGFEHVHEKTLAPTHGKLTYLRDVRRRALWIDPDGYKPGQTGGTARLSIDLIIQEIAERRLRQAVSEFNAGGGRMVVLDVQTGEILAMVDVLNNKVTPRGGNWMPHTTDPMRWIHPALARNRCVTDPYEPGSTFKPFVWAVATELGKAKLEEVLPTPPPGVVFRTSRGRQIRDAYNTANVTWRTVLIKSLNSGMAIVAERMTEREMREAVTRFGFGQRTNCGLPGETAGILTSRRNWNHYTQTSVAMGHEIAVTPLQMVRAFAVFARDGTLPKLRTTAAIEGDDVEIVHRVLPADITLIAREAMRDVMTQGTGRKAQSERYQLFSKSGTAQLPRADRRGYHQDRYVSSFIAGAPFNEPRLVVLCVIDDPDKDKGHFGGAIAGPVVRDVIDEALDYLGVEPDQPNAAQHLAAR